MKPEYAADILLAIARHAAAELDKEIAGIMYLNRKPAGTFHGFPVVIDPAMPRDTINLEQGGQVVGTIRVASE